MLKELHWFPISGQLFPFILWGKGDKNEKTRGSPTRSALSLPLGECLALGMPQRNGKEKNCCQNTSKGKPAPGLICLKPLPTKLMDPKAEKRRREEHPSSQHETRLGNRACIYSFMSLVKIATLWHGLTRHFAPSASAKTAQTAPMCIAKAFLALQPLSPGCSLGWQEGGQQEAAQSCWGRAGQSP